MPELIIMMLGAFRRTNCQVHTALPTFPCRKGLQGAKLLLAQRMPQSLNPDSCVESEHANHYDKAPPPFPPGLKPHRILHDGTKTTGLKGISFCVKSRNIQTNL